MIVSQENFDQKANIGDQCWQYLPKGKLSVLYKFTLLKHQNFHQNMQTKDMYSKLLQHCGEDYLLVSRLTLLDLGLGITGLCLGTNLGPADSNLG